MSVAKCRGITHANKSCGRKATKYGVCSQHSGQACDGGKSEDVRCFVLEYTDLCRQAFLHFHGCESQGIHYESAYGTNLTTIIDHKTLPSSTHKEQMVRDAVEYLELLRSTYTKYPQFNQYLLCNLGAAIRMYVEKDELNMMTATHRHYDQCLPYILSVLQTE